MGRAFLRRLFSQSLKDIQPGDAVRIAGYRGVCFVREVNGDTAVVVWNRDNRDIVPLVCLRRVRACGKEYDARGE